MIGTKKKQKKRNLIKYIYICMLLKIILKYEVSINTSIHLGMRIYFFYISLQYLINKNDFFILIIALTL